MYTTSREPPLPPRPRVAATRTTQPPVIDGKLDDPAWRAAAMSDTFTQHFPDEGAPPSERTELRVLYDDRNVYIAVDCHQTKSPIVRRLQRRDGPLPSDGVWIDIDSRRDGTSAFHFSINAAGALSDGIHFDDTSYSTDWDAVWEAKVADTGHGYAIEFRIPLSALRFSKLPVQDWGFQVRRFIDARQETDDWAFYPRTAGTYVPLFGRLENLVGLDPRHPIELRPFVLGRAGHRSADADATLDEGWSATGSIGLDAKLHVTNELSLDVALNPDFGQVEADAVILNLSTFETFFPEKRPFFLEGIDTFAGIRPVVYTRRIGGLPLAAALGPSEVLVANPDPSPLYGAAKLVGTIGGRTNVGVISAITGATYVDVQRLDGARERRRIDPWTAYNIARVKRTLGANTSVGLLATATNRLEAPTAVGSLCPATGLPTGADGRCTNDAYVVTGDGRWRSPLGHYALAWQAIGSALSGGPERPQPDGIPIRPGHVAGGGALLRRQGRRHELAVELLAVPVGTNAGVQRRRLPGTQERLPGLSGGDLPDAAAVVAHHRDQHDVEAEPAPDAGRPEPVERDQARDVVEHPQLLVVLPGRARARPVLRRPRDGRRHRAPAPRPRRPDRRLRLRSAAPRHGRADVERRPAARRRRLPAGQRPPDGARAASAGARPLSDRRLRIGPAALRRQEPAVANHHDISVRHADRRQRGRDAARRVHVHADAVAAAVHAAVHGARTLRSVLHVHHGRRRARAHRRPGRTDRAEPPPTANARR